jgi:DNA polymerase I-like protein with 3'-5' exonuclease and polymerase domains
LWNNKFHKRTEVNKTLSARKILDNIEIHEIKPHEIESTFKLIKQMKTVALDYETTNLKPYDPWFEITHISFGNSQVAWVFHESLWNDHPTVWDDLIAPNMRSILTDKNILKVIQNSKFEDLVSRYMFGIKRIENMFCTMLATHVIDERRGCTSLDFQNLVRFGIPPYSENVKSYLEKKDKDAFTNNIRSANHDDLILYAGLDIITTYANYKVLNEQLLPKAYPKARENYEFLLNGHIVFANMTERGIKIGETEFDEFTELIENKINEIALKIRNDSDVIAFNELLKEEQMPTPKNNIGDRELKNLANNIKRKLTMKG